VQTERAREKNGETDFRIGRAERRCTSRSGTAERVIFYDVYNLPLATRCAASRKPLFAWIELGDRCATPRDISRVTVRARARARAREARPVRLAWTAIGADADADEGGRPYGFTQSRTHVRPRGMSIGDAERELIRISC